MLFSSIHQQKMKKQSKKGRCLHFDDNIRCNEIISAHSIQKQGQLKLIAEDNHVYRVNGDLSNMKKNQGRLSLKRTGIKDASTFPGMCKHHDNKIFAPIDNSPLDFNQLQMSLYAYRSICREYFVKENAVVTSTEMMNHPGLSQTNSLFLQSLAAGQKLGFERLKRHKEIYDAALAARDYSGFKFVILRSKSRCSVQASGLIFPDFDFQGHSLQDLGPHTKALDLLTFFTAPTDEGWAFALAWHDSSDRTCQNLLSSFAQTIRDGARPEDTLLRFCLLSCENHAIRISWWDALPDESKTQALEYMSDMVDYTSGLDSNYLCAGFEGLADWNFDSIQGP